ncbi:hypothetical protein BDV96DRAFT_632277 [Lophiotrema nucula]|uniref:Uncharacterized protein n=1 Tax=Lophiotrema nucula TaxID=690887 RepID=A0A6A5Z601_9PLEO|nr:hypothetical protein BDV96DRAFT_632277 [Lophiotrema nucula]
MATQSNGGSEGTSPNTSDPTADAAVVSPEPTTALIADTDEAQPPRVEGTTKSETTAAAPRPEVLWCGRCGRNQLPTIRSYLCTECNADFHGDYACEPHCTCNHYPKLVAKCECRTEWMKETWWPKSGHKRTYACEVTVIRNLPAQKPSYTTNAMSEIRVIFLGLFATHDESLLHQTQILRLLRTRSHGVIRKSLQLCYENKPMQGDNENRYEGLYYAYRYYKAVYELKPKDWVGKPQEK